MHNEKIILVLSFLICSSILIIFIVNSTRPKKDADIHSALKKRVSLLQHMVDTHYANIVNHEDLTIDYILKEQGEEHFLMLNGVELFKYTLIKKTDRLEVKGEFVKKAKRNIQKQRIR